MATDATPQTETVRVPVFPKAVRRSIIAALLVITGLAVFGLTRLGSDGGQPDESILKSVEPGPNDKIPQQGQVRVELMTGWDGTMSIDQKQIPNNQLIRNNEDRMASYQAFIFQPGPGKVLESFPAGLNCATVTYWRVDTGPSQSFAKTWCFTAF